MGMYFMVLSSYQLTPNFHANNVDGAKSSTCMGMRTRLWPFDNVCYAKENTSTLDL